MYFDRSESEGSKNGRFKRPFDKWEMKPKTVLIKNENHYERIPSPETMRLELNYIYDFGHLGGKNYKCKYNKRSYHRHVRGVVPVEIVLTQTYRPE